MDAVISALFDTKKGRLCKIRLFSDYVLFRNYLIFNSKGISAIVSPRFIASKRAA